jgi:glutathione S-transferase
MTLVLFSHHGCPYVQRVAIVLAEKNIPHTRRDVEFKAKPAEFLAASPLGQVPAMLINGATLFDSIAICEYLEDRFEPRLHPRSAEERGRHRAWMAFGSTLLQSVGGFFKAQDVRDMEIRRKDILWMLARLELELRGAPYFSGSSFSLVDAVFAPVFRYFEAFSEMERFDFLRGSARVAAWQKELMDRPSVAQAVGTDFHARLVEYLSTRDSAFARQALPSKGLELEGQTLQKAAVRRSRVGGYIP